MKRFVFSFFSLLLLLLLAACRGPATTPPPLPTATSAAVQPTAAPSNTPASAATPSPAASPTFTSTPTSTQVLTPTQTLTPTVAATVTPDPNQGVGDMVFEDRFDGASGWGWTFQGDGVSFGAANGQLIGAMTRGDIGWSLTLGPDSLRTGDNQIRVVAQPASCSDGDEFGIFFRGALSDEGKFAGYLFKLNCAGQAGVDLMQDSTPRALLEWTDSPAVRPGAGAQNTLMVWMARDEFRFYVNDQYLASVKNATQTEGDFGFYLWKRGEGEARVAFDDLAIRAVTPP